MRKLLKTGLGPILLVLAGAAGAQSGGGEKFQLEGASVTVFARDFLTQEELLTLRLVGQNRDALAVFVPEGGGFAALAVAPGEGFVRGGVPVESASALSGLATIEAAREAARAACDSARSGGAPCEVVLEIAPD